MDGRARREVCRGTHLVTAKVFEKDARDTNFGECLRHALGGGALNPPCEKGLHLSIVNGVHMTAQQHAHAYAHIQEAYLLLAKLFCNAGTDLAIHGVPRVLVVSMCHSCSQHMLCAHR